MKRLISACILTLAATNAAALSCLPTNVAGSYIAAAEAEETFVILHGSFDFDQAELPLLPPNNRNPRVMRVDAQFTGGVFTGKNFSFETELDVQIEARCFGPWCSWMEVGTEVLAFVEKRDDAYFLTLSPCGGWLYARPKQAQLDQVVSCHQGDTCEPPAR
ncbi:MAG: hypothetical protein AAGF13_02095 [Pseudomonadota bacterium]